MHCFNRYSSGRQFIYYRNIEIPVKGHCQGSWNGSSRHYKDMRRILTLFPKSCTLCNTEPVLLIDYDKTKVTEPNIFLDQGSSSDEDIQGVIFKCLIDCFPFTFF